VSAYPAKARLVLAQRAIVSKSKEIVALPDLLPMLDLQGGAVTIDAMGCQGAIADQVIDRLRTLPPIWRRCGAWG
jgi:hypothetical protein